MFFRILRKDLKRKRTMNLITFLFIVLASMFVASGINNVVTVTNGTDYYLDLAGVGDYMVITMGPESIGALDDIIDRESAITAYKTDEVLFGSKSDITAEGKDEIESKNAVIYQSIEHSNLKFFDLNNNEITEIRPGYAYVSGSFMETNGFEPGDKITIKKESAEFEVTLEGKAKDAMLGSDMMGNTRVLLNEREMKKLLDDEINEAMYQGEIYYLETEDDTAVSSALSDAGTIAFDGSKKTIKMCYVMDMIIAFITLILSICMIIVSFVVLKFSITFTISEEFREIGVMKAIGIGNLKIRFLYLTKYMLLAVAGSALGFIISIPFGRMLIQSVSNNMVLLDENNILPNIIGSIIVITVILAFAFKCTGRVKKSSPIDAIRSGQTGERYKKKTVLRLGSFNGSTSFFMALNDVLSAPKRFFTIVITFCLCTMFVLILVNTTETMDSPALVGTFGAASDLYITDVNNSMNKMGGYTKAEFQEYIDDMADEITGLGMPCTVAVEVQYKYKISSKGNNFNITCQQGMNKISTDYEYTDGIVPESKNEIAITPQISELINAKIGDTVTIDFGTEKIDCIVVAYFQSMNQLGQIIRLHEDAPTSFDYISSMMSYQVDFTDSPDDATINSRRDELKDYYDNDKVMNQTEYCDDCMNVVDTMRSVQYLLLGITLVVVLLVTILMERTFISDEKSQIAILKAMGFRDSRIISWHVTRFAIVGVISALLAAVLSIPMTHVAISPIFSMMGASDVQYVINPLQIFVVYPGIICLMTVLVATITALYTKQIKSNDTANIE